MAVVYEAIELSIDRRVAVKVLNERFRNDADYRMRFRNEAKIAARIEHNNLVSIYHCRVEAEGLPYIVMELLRGRDLQKELKLVGKMDWRRAARLVIQLCSALHAAHRRNVIHRDVKPANCFLFRLDDERNEQNNEKGNEPNSETSIELDQLKLLDLGIAKLSGDIESFEMTSPLTKQGHVMGTWPYMAPEQLTQKPVFRTDLYAVGAVLYRLITGQHAIERSGSTDIEYQTRILFEAPRPPTEFAPDIPAELEDLILRALAKSVEDRPPNAAAIREILERCLAADAMRGSLLDSRPPLKALFYTVSAIGGLSLTAALAMLFSVAGFADDQPSRLDRSTTRTEAAWLNRVDDGQTTTSAGTSSSTTGAPTSDSGTTADSGTTPDTETSDTPDSHDSPANSESSAHSETTDENALADDELVLLAEADPPPSARSLISKAVRRRAKSLRSCDANPIARKVAVTLRVHTKLLDGVAVIDRSEITAIAINKKNAQLQRHGVLIACVKKRLQGLELPDVEEEGRYQRIKVSIR